MICPEICKRCERCWGIDIDTLKIRLPPFFNAVKFGCYDIDKGNNVITETVLYHGQFKYGDEYKEMYKSLKKIVPRKKLFQNNNLILFKINKINDEVLAICNNIKVSKESCPYYLEHLLME